MYPKSSLKKHVIIDYSYKKANLFNDFKNGKNEQIFVLF